MKEDFDLENGGANYPTDDEARGMRAGLRAGPEVLIKTSKPINLSSDITVSGATGALAGVYNGLYEESGTHNGRPKYEYGPATIRFDGAVWEIVGVVDYVYKSEGDAVDPVDETWVIPDGSLATGDITVEHVYDKGEVGQVCRVGSSDPYDWYRYDGDEAGWIEEHVDSFVVSESTAADYSGATGIPIKNQLLIFDSAAVVDGFSVSLPSNEGQVRAGQIVRIMSKSFNLTNLNVFSYNGDVIPVVTPFTLAPETVIEYQCINIDGTVDWVRVY